jgi:hypothetical protein
MQDQDAGASLVKCLKGRIMDPEKTSSREDGPMLPCSIAAVNGVLG